MNEISEAAEFDIAGEILDPIVRQSGVDVIVSGRDEIRFRIHKRFGWRLASVVLGRGALRKLLGDPQREVKVDFLRRELLRALTSRREFRYPRPLTQASSC
jgi:hypothetical protein